MHRRGANFLVDIASTSSNTRAVGARRYGSLNPVRKRRPPVPRMIPQASYDKLELTSKGLISAAVTKDHKVGWKHPRGPEGETRRLTSAVKGYQNPAKPPSQEKEQFISATEDDEPFTNLEMEEGYFEQRFQPGTLVEIRRSVPLAS